MEATHFRFRFAPTYRASYDAFSRSQDRTHSYIRVIDRSLFCNSDDSEKWEKDFAQAKGRSKTINIRQMLVQLSGLCKFVDQRARSQHSSYRNGKVHGRREVISLRFLFEESSRTTVPRCCVDCVSRGKLPEVACHLYSCPIFPPLFTSHMLSKFS